MTLGCCSSSFLMNAEITVIPIMLVIVLGTEPRVYCMLGKYSAS